MEQPVAKILGKGGEGCGIHGRILQNVNVHLLFVLRHKWRMACVHFKDQNTETPPVDGEGMPYFLQDFGRHVPVDAISCKLVTLWRLKNEKILLGGAAKCFCKICSRHFLRKTEVR